MKKILSALAGALAGFLNGLFGSGGGMAAVPLLKALGADDRKAHATSLLVIAVLSLFSIGMYLRGGGVRLSDAAAYLPGGVIGAAAGALLLRRLPLRWLRLIFSGVVLFSAWRLWNR